MELKEHNMPEMAISYYDTEYANLNPSYLAAWEPRLLNSLRRIGIYTKTAVTVVKIEKYDKIASRDGK